MELHDYQDEACTNGTRELDRAEAALIVIPTGGGKTVVGAAIASEFVRRGGRVLILMHRKELIEQWSRACDAFELNWAIEQAEQKAHRDTLHGRVDVVIGSKDTMQGKRLERWSPHTFSLIIADECHRSIMKTWMNVFAHFHSARRLGLTATPRRSDDESVQTVFGNCAYELEFWRAIDLGWIVPPFFHRPPMPVDLSKLRTVGDDLNQGDLEDVISKHIGPLVTTAAPLIDGRQTMCFTPRVYSATMMADGFRQLKPPISSCSVSGQSSDRDLVVKRFRNSEFQLLASCDLLREGADFPVVSAGIMARPTKSELVYRQSLGRLLRRHPGKTHAVVVDYAWNSGKHDLFQPIDLFDATGMDLDVLKLAGRYLNEGKHQDPREALKEADRVHREEVALKVQIRERTPSYRMLAYDPFQVGSLLGIPNRQREGQKPCTARNRARLESFKLSAKGMANAQAEKLLQELERRRHEHLATHRQVALLVSQGVPQEFAQAMPFDAASEDLNLIVGERKRA